MGMCPNIGQKCFENSDSAIKKPAVKQGETNSQLNECVTVCGLFGRSVVAGLEKREREKCAQGKNFRQNYLEKKTFSQMRLSF